MDVVVERCAGLDVHRDDVVATVRVPGAGRRRWDRQTRTFRATLAGLSALGEWLTEAEVTRVGMEATGVYWKPVFWALEQRFECWLLNAHHLRNVPGRKTDVKDSEWICQLVAHGLVRPSFVPPPEIRRLRDLTRLRKAQINERARCIQRLEKVLIAECGLDMARFPTVKHFVSWAGACPGHHESAGRRRSGHTRPGPRWLTDTLTECAKAAARTKGTYLAAHFVQLRGRRGEPKAIGAIRHDLLVAYYHVVRDQVPFRELGPDWQRKRYSPEHRARRLQRQLQALGYTVTLQPTEQTAPTA
jgi:transposase